MCLYLSSRLNLLLHYIVNIYFFKHFIGTLCFSSDSDLEIVAPSDPDALVSDRKKDSPNKMINNDFERHMKPYVLESTVSKMCAKIK